MRFDAWFYHMVKKQEHEIWCMILSLHGENKQKHAFGWVEIGWMI